jgi:hypothetical protein
MKALSPSYHLCTVPPCVPNFRVYSRTCKPSTYPVDQPARAHRIVHHPSNRLLLLLRRPLRLNAYLLWRTLSSRLGPISPIYQHHSLPPPLQVDIPFNSIHPRLLLLIHKAQFRPEPSHILDSRDSGRIIIQQGLSLQPLAQELITGAHGGGVKGGVKDRRAQLLPCQPYF